jgi:hypothetical protein
LTVEHLNARMVAGGNRIETKRSAALDKSVELQVTVAFNARIWRGSIDVRGHVWLDNMLVEIVGEIEDKVIDTNLLCNTASIVNIGHRTTTCVAFATPQTHGDTNNVVTLLTQDECCSRRIDTAGHCDKNFHGFTAVSRCAAATVAAIALEMSSSVVVCPKLKRREPLIRAFGTPIAARTCDGSIAPLAHADAAETQTPAESSKYNNDSLSRPSKHT